MDKHIALYKTPVGWLAKSDSFIESMGTDVLPTAFTVNAPEAVVLKKIRELNPGFTVEVMFYQSEF